MKEQYCKKYVEARNKLIGQAEQYANKAVGKATRKHADDLKDKWNRAYFAKMDELATEAGLMPWMEGK